jgi:hypothetical protein
MAKDEDSEDWVEVAETGKQELAALIAGLLRSEGIPVEVEGPGSHPWPETIGALGTSRITVPPDRAAEAREIIASHEKKSPSRSTERIESVPEEPGEE